jgi:hypothetical protein
MIRWWTPAGSCRSVNSLMESYQQTTAQVHVLNKTTYLIAPSVVLYLGISAAECLSNPFYFETRATHF